MNMTRKPLSVADRIQPMPMVAHVAPPAPPVAESEPAVPEAATPPAAEAAPAPAATAARKKRKTSALADAVPERLPRKAGRGTRREPRTRVSDGQDTRAVSVLLPVSRIEELDKLAVAKGVTRSRLVEQALALVMGD
jgi:hypothetical protein